MGRGRWGSGQREGGDGKRGKRGVGEEGARGEQISRMDMMKCLGGRSYKVF